MYANDALAHIAEQLELANWLKGAEAEENPFPFPESYPRAYQLWKNPKKDDSKEEVSVAEFDQTNFG